MVALLVCWEKVSRSRPTRVTADCTEESASTILLDLGHDLLGALPRGGVGELHRQHEEALVLLGDERSRHPADRAATASTTITRKAAIPARGRRHDLPGRVDVPVPGLVEPAVEGPEEPVLGLSRGGPEQHGAEGRGEGWERLRKPVHDLLPGRDGGEGLSEEALAAFPEGARSDALVAKFQTPESLKLLVAGGSAGRFTAIVPGWPFRNAPSRLVFRKIASP